MEIIGKKIRIVLKSFHYYIIYGNYTAILAHGVKYILSLFQENLDLKLAPKLSSGLLKPSHFNKMRVPDATRVLSRDVAAALKYLVEKEGRPKDYLTTAWLIDSIAKWFSLMTSRNPILALSRMNESR